MSDPQALTSEMLPEQALEANGIPHIAQIPWFPRDQDLTLTGHQLAPRQFAWSGSRVFLDC